MLNKYAPISIILCAFLFQSCAIRGIMLDEDRIENETYTNSETSRSFFIAGNTYKSDPEFTKVFTKAVLENPAKEKRILFVGNNIKGKDSTAIIKDLNDKAALIQSSKANVHIIPGKFEWKYDKLKGLEFMEDYLEEKLQTETNFMTPNNGCPLESIEIGEDIQLIVINSQWYIENWDSHPNFNDKCQKKIKCMNKKE